jgi:prepilin-type processing-associated H-X9-DG protein
MQIFPYVKSRQVYACPSDVTVLPTQPGSDNYHIVSYATNMNFGSLSGGVGLGAAIAGFTATSKTVMLFEVGRQMAWVDRQGVYNEADNVKSSGFFANNPNSIGGTPTVAGTGLQDQLYSVGGSGINATLNFQGTYATGTFTGRTCTVNPNSSGKWLDENGRHLEGSNYLMVDGHVKWYRSSSVSSGRPATSSTAAQGTNAAGAETSTFAVTFSPI